jgi:hypothetical protein
MKRKLLLGGFLLIVALLATFTPAAAQLQVNPNNMQFYYFYPLATTKTYANSQIDTLPSPAASATTVKVGGASFLTFNIVALDSIKADVYIDYRIVGVAAWTTYTDSLISTVDAGVTSKEYLLRTQKTDNILEGMLAELRVRIACRAAGCGTTTATYTAKFLWKP